MKITVQKPFLFMRKDATPKHFGIGVHEVTEDEAGHWYVQAHSDVDPDELAAAKAAAALKVAEAEQAAADAAAAAAAAASALADAAVAGKKAK